MNRTNATTAVASDLKLLVRRVPGSATRFNLIVVKGDEVIETVTANSAQLIKDYIESEWPVGTRVQWLVVGYFENKRAK